MLTAYSTSSFELPLPEGHRFPMAKYRLLLERVMQELPEVRIEKPEAADDSALGLVHNDAYINAVVNGTLDVAAQRRIGFPWSPAMVHRSRRSVGATIAALSTAFKRGVAINLAGGTHHAHADYGSGFCVFNDAAVAVRNLQHNNGGLTALIVDLDVHQGDGTAQIFASDKNVFTFSMHGDKNFPARKSVSDLDVALPDNTGDDEYLDCLQESLLKIEKCFNPDCVLYLAGADPFEQDRLGRLSLSKQALLQRDVIVFDHYRRRNKPIAVMMAGGYADNIHDIVDIHFATIRLAQRYVTT